MFQKQENGERAFTGVSSEDPKLLLLRGSEAKESERKEKLTKESERKDKRAKESERQEAAQKKQNLAYIRSVEKQQLKIRQREERLKSAKHPSAGNHSAEPKILLQRHEE